VKKVIIKKVYHNNLPATFVKGFHDLVAVRKMKYAPLGITGMNVSRLAFGAASLGCVYDEVGEE
jgi:L-galactose dehydrogenase